jgi:translocator protein
VAQTTVTRTPLQQSLGLLGWLALTFLAAALGAIASAQAGAFYASLAKPSWAPPGWLFGPVWSVLYVLMAVAAWLVWRGTALRLSQGALGFFVVQLCANSLWTWMFFVWKQGAWAFAEVLVLWCLILVCIVCFWRLSRIAAVLLAPYLAWVSFATALTWATWRANPQILG